MEAIKSITDFNMLFNEGIIVRFSIRTIITIVALTVSGIILPSTATGQSGKGMFSTSGNDPITGGGGQSSSVPITALLSETRYPTDNIIVPELYYLGPGDLLVLQLVGALEGEYPLVVTPENTLLVPRFGEISVEGKTLAEIKKEVARLAAERNSIQKAYLSLQRARNVLVTIKGNVTLAGTYSLPASMRISTAIMLARRPKSGLEGVPLPGQLPQPFAQMDYTVESSSTGEEIWKASLRSVKVSRRDGTFFLADIAKARLLNDAKSDPTIREGDDITVPYDNETVADNILSISGAVERPAIIPFRAGDTYELLIKAAGALTANADSANIVVRSAGKGEEMLTWGQLLAKAQAPLESGMAIHVANKTAQVAEPFVVIVGKVQKPGVYKIDPAKTRFADVVAMAGGLTTDDNAYLPLSTIERRRDSLYRKGMNSERAMRLFQYSNLGIMDSARFKIDVLLPPNRVAADLSLAFDTTMPSTSKFPFGWIGEMFTSRRSDSLRKAAIFNNRNPLMESGDIIRIAENPRTVMVFGQVKTPGFVEFQEGMPLSWYIRNAGGKGEYAASGRTRIIRGGSNVWMEQDAPIYAGDLVYVPAEPDVPPGTDLQYYSAIASIVSTTAFFASTLLNVLNKP